MAGFDFQRFTERLKQALPLTEGEIILELYSAINNLIQAFASTERGYDTWCRYNIQEADTRNIACYSKKIDRIVKILDSNDQKWKTFLRNFPSLKTHRKKSMTKLRAMAKNLATIHMVSNVLKILAGAVGIAAGVAIIVSLLFPPKPPPLLPHWLGGESASSLLPAALKPATPTASPLAFAAAVAAAGRAAFDIGARISELVLTQTKLDQVHQVIEEDRKLLKSLGVFEFLDELNNAIDDLFGTRASSRILSDIIEFVRTFQPILNEIESFPLKYLLLHLMVKLPYISKFLFVGPPLAATIMSIFFIRRRGWANLSPRIALGLARTVDACVGISRLTAATFLKDFKFGELIPRDLTGKVGVGAIAGVGIVIDIVSIVMYSLDLAKRSQSDEVPMIYKVANELETNLKSYHIVNNELRKCLMRRLKTTDLSMWEPLPNNTLDQSRFGSTIKTHLLKLLFDFCGNLSYA